MASSPARNESDVWLSFINGDKEAFSVFYKQNYSRLYSYGISLGMDEDQIRDIIQELFIKLYTKPHLVKEVATIQSFLLVSMRNAFINDEKYKKKHINWDQIENFELHYSVENNRIEDDEELQRIKEKVDKIIKSLTPRQKEIIYLKFLYQKDYEEVAQIMNMSEQAARNLTYRAMEKIRKDHTEFMVWMFMLFLISR